HSDQEPESEKGEEVDGGVEDDGGEVDVGRIRCRSTEDQHLPQHTGRKQRLSVEEITQQKENGDCSAAEKSGVGCFTPDRMPVHHRSLLTSERAGSGVRSPVRKTGRIHEIAVSGGGSKGL